MLEPKKNKIKTKFSIKIFSKCPFLKMKVYKIIDLYYKTITTCKIFNLEIYNAPFFELKLYNMWDFEVELLKRVGFWKKLKPKVTFWIIFLRENDSFCVFRAVLKKFNFQMITLKSVSFWIKIFNVSYSGSKILLLIQCKNLTLFQHIYFSEHFPPNHHEHLQITIFSSTR